MRLGRRAQGWGSGGAGCARLVWGQGLREGACVGERGAAAAAARLRGVHGWHALG